MRIEQHDDNTVTIEGTRYAACLFEELGCGFPSMVGQVLRVDKKEDGLVTVTHLYGIEKLAASHQRLVEAVKKLNAVHCKISQVVMQSIPDDEGNDILAALAEAEELIKKEG